eukprot:COSAG03_NODE_187_length_10937_cov_22.349788_6_plen_210_part_00
MWIRCAYHGHEECPKEEEIEPGEHNDQSSRGLARLLAEDGDVGVGVGLRLPTQHSWSARAGVAPLLSHIHMPMSLSLSLALQRRTGTSFCETQCHNRTCRLSLTTCGVFSRWTQTIQRHGTNSSRSRRGRDRHTVPAAWWRFTSHSRSGTTANIQHVHAVLSLFAAARDPQLSQGIRALCPVTGWITGPDLSCQAICRNDQDSDDGRRA